MSDLIDQLLVDGEQLDGNIAGRIVDWRVSESMELAGELSVTVEDSDALLLGSGVLARRNPRKKKPADTTASPWQRLGKVRCQLNGLNYRLAGYKINGDQVVLQWEEEPVALLRAHKAVREVSRGSMTRFQFIRMLVLSVREHRIPFVIPNPTKRRPIDRTQDKRTQKDRDHDREPGFADNANITVKGVKADKSQLRVIDESLAECNRQGCSHRVMIADVMTMTQESVCRSIRFGDQAGPDSRGPFQQRAPWGPENDRLDPTVSTRMFLTGGQGGQPGWKQKHGSLRNARGDLNALITAVQVSVGGYAQWEEEATKTVDAWGGSDGSAVDRQEQTEIREQFEFTTLDGDDEPQNYWDASGRIAGDVDARRFVSQGTFYTGFDSDLLLARPLLIIARRMVGLLDIQAEQHYNKPASIATLTLDADAWQVPAGTVVELDRSYGTGLAGRWLVNTVDKPARQPAIVELRTEAPAKPEPDTTRRVLSTTTSGQAGVSDLTGVKLTQSWGGTKSIFDQFVTPFMADQGLEAGNEKRTPFENQQVDGSPTSDHLTTQKTSYAVDYPTTNGAKAARALAVAMGFTGWQENREQSFHMQVDGRRFRVQILWGLEIEHGDHVHVGIRLA